MRHKAYGLEWHVQRHSPRRPPQSGVGRVTKLRREDLSALAEAQRAGQARADAAPPRKAYAVRTTPGPRASRRGRQLHTRGRSDPARRRLPPDSLGRAARHALKEVDV